MKKCSYCGRENSDEASHCFECGTEFDPIAPPPPPRQPEPAGPRYRIRALSPEEAKLDLVTIVRCGTLIEADMIRSQLEVAGITAWIPDEFLAEAFAFDLNAVGYVRVQVSPKDYEAAKDVIEDAERLPTLPSSPSAPDPDSAL
jgi:Putative prokaryotic signal transducing protein